MSDRMLNAFAKELIDVMPDVIRGMWRQEINECSSSSITPPQMFILVYLHKAGEMRMTDIARYLNVSTAAATGLIDRLVKSAYVARVYDPQDRRIIKVKLTQRGLAVIARVFEHKIGRIKDVFHNISEQDRQDYLRVVKRLKEVLDQEQKAEKT
jgi:DNA-binding MarR family transcriptional regulator